MFTPGKGPGNSYGQILHQTECFCHINLLFGSFRKKNFHLRIYTYVVWTENDNNMFYDNEDIARPHCVVPVMMQQNTKLNLLCSTDRFKAVVPVLVFVSLWFILRGDLLYVFPCVILFLCFSLLLVLRLPRLGKRELILVLFVRLFGLCLFKFVGFLFLLGHGKGCGLWLWHSLDFSLTFFFYIALFVF